MGELHRYAVRFTGLNKAMVVLGLTPARSFVEVSPATMRVHMAWAFDAVVERSSIVSVGRDDERVWGWGVHGWRGAWLVNGSSSQVVRIEIAPPARVRLMRIFPVSLRLLRVSVEQPDEMIAEFAPT